MHSFQNLCTRSQSAQSAPHCGGTTKRLAQLQSRFGSISQQPPSLTYTIALVSAAQSSQDGWDPRCRLCCNLSACQPCATLKHTGTHTALLSEEDSTHTLNALCKGGQNLTNRLFTTLHAVTLGQGAPTTGPCQQHQLSCRQATHSTRLATSHLRPAWSISRARPAKVQSACKKSRHTGAGHHGSTVVRNCIN
jgi:hypothetical protein